MKFTTAALILAPLVVADDQCSVGASDRYDCGQISSNQTSCEGKWEDEKLVHCASKRGYCQVFFSRGGQKNLTLADKILTNNFICPLLTASGCCWSPLDDGVSGPWCFFKKGDEPKSCFVPVNSTDTSPFTSDEIDTMKGYFTANINVEQVGAVVAAPDNDTPGGSYYFHWMRDGALTMHAYQIITPTTDESYQTTMESYITWVLGRQALSSVNDEVDVRVEPKFMIPSGDVFDGGWCRPQNDGPGLRAIALITYANSGVPSDDYVKDSVWKAVKDDLDWIVDGWDTMTCDLWEEIRSDDLFWNRVTMKKALTIGAEFASSMGDSASSASYTSIASKIDDNLDTHWTGSFVQEDSNRQKDGAVFIGFNNGYTDSDSKYAPTSQEVASTIATLVKSFCQEYGINALDKTNNVPGVLIGRYPGDTYANGNPWVLTTAALGQLLYRAASYTLSNGLPSADALGYFTEGLNLSFSDSSDASSVAATLAAAGDSVMLRIKEHVKDDGGHLDEQIDRDTGKQLSAKDLTWSYAEVLLAMDARDKYLDQAKK